MLKKVRIAVVGSRHYQNKAAIFKVLKSLIRNLDPDDIEIVCGEAAGPDTIGREFAEENNIPVKSFRPDWDNIEADGAVIKTNKHGNKYNARAGFTRNKEMGDYATHVVAFWDNKSKGTKQMIDYAVEKRLVVRIFATD